MIKIEKSITLLTTINDDKLVKIVLTNMNNNTTMILERFERGHLGLSDYITVGVLGEYNQHGRSSIIDFFTVDSKDEKVYEQFKRLYEKLQNGGSSLAISTDESVAREYGGKYLTFESNPNKIEVKDYSSLTLTYLNCIYLFTKNRKTKEVYSAFNELINELSKEYESNNEKVRKMVYKSEI